MVEIAEPFECMFTPKRYKVWYGGRGGGKSWGVADGLLIKGTKDSLRILCTREIQNSIKDSVHKVLCDRIKALKLENFYRVTNNSITGVMNETEFMFEGLRHNIDSIRSKEGVDIVWVEEAHKVSKASWDVLIPTIRKEGSEIWITFNPELDTDETYKRFVLNPPEDSFVIKVNWKDNPWFPEVLKKELYNLKKQDYDSFLHVYEGHCKQMLEGAVYARELRTAVEEGRVTRVDYDPTKPVHTFWDLGWRDATAIWFAQVVGFDYRIIDYHQDVQRTVNHYLKVLQSKDYIYGLDFLPHDADATNMPAGGRTIKGLMLEAGRKVRIIPNTKIAVGINAARTIFANCWFDEQRCADGLNCLRRYRYEKDDKTGTYQRIPVHDEYSHGADAFRYLALGLRERKEAKLDNMLPDSLKLKTTIQQAQATGRKKIKLDLPIVDTGLSWMS